ncbi:hypothetical protein O6H91_15G036100 [Diphasiastrum complanatum]|uniref:Uncharacterized protein n=1 Tax=Diphasiastrum complanatum TaxID=34168 RepID=A0ACC2BHA9_DIPCM|nr:hypothetical protein O6H91_15G036100 [Diphasiastrum complanatum]
MPKAGRKRNVGHAPKGVGRKAKSSKVASAAAGRDDFFAAEDEELVSSEDEQGDQRRGGANREEEDEEENDDLNGAETADEKRLRLAKAYLDRLRAAAEEDQDIDDEREELEGRRDSLVADLLKQEQLEESGRVQRKLAARVLKPSTLSDGNNVSRRHRQSVTAITLTEDDSKGFAASKDGLIVQWNIETGQSDMYVWPNQEAASSVPVSNLKPKRGKKGRKEQGSRHVLSLAVSSDGRYLASGGLDRSVHLWDTRNREHIQAFAGHRGAVSSLVFRRGTQQLMSGSFDRTIKLWSADDRSYIDTLFGHQSEVLTLDCLRQERLLSAGRDRTLRIWKIPEETQLVFRGHAASLECCCFISNAEFLSGSDDGSVALWSTMRKKPVFLAKNAHENGFLGAHTSVHSCGAVESWVGAVCVCRGSDLAASGAGDGSIRLWAIEEENRSLRALHSLPVKGFVNSLAFAYTGRFLLAGVGQEPRLGRWGRNPEARNGVVMHKIDYS